MYYHYGDGWAWMSILMPLIWFALIGFAAWVVVRFTRNSTDAPPRDPAPGEHRDSPEEILDRRFAAGEIDADTHAAGRAHLKAHPR